MIINFAKTVRMSSFIASKFYLATLSVVSLAFFHHLKIFSVIESESQILAYKDELVCP